jgi:hypothetical protein
MSDCVLCLWPFRQGSHLTQNCLETAIVPADTPGLQLFLCGQVHRAGELMEDWTIGQRIKAHERFSLGLRSQGNAPAAVEETLVFLLRVTDSGPLPELCLTYQDHVCAFSSQCRCFQVRCKIKMRDPLPA